MRRGRTSPRLKGFDYSSRHWYFVTINAKGHQPLFGTLAQDGVNLSEAGLIVNAEWCRTAELRSDVALDAFIIMPDHFHGLVGLHDNDTPCLRGLAPQFSRRAHPQPSPFRSGSPIHRG